MSHSRFFRMSVKSRCGAIAVLLYRSGRRIDDCQWVRNARKTVQWTVFSGERAEAPEGISSILSSSEKELSPLCGAATIENAEGIRYDYLLIFSFRREWKPTDYSFIH